MSELPINLERPLQQTMLRDSFRLQRKAQDIRQREKQGKPIDQMVERWQQEWESSKSLVDKRAQVVPQTIEFPENLPVSGKREEIAQLINDNQVVVLAGETGSGKTTQLPKICLQLGLGVRGMIGHTQPRRIAAQTVAARVAEELGSNIGETVGYQVRFTEQAQDTTLVKVMTDGILLAEIQQDPMLNRYDTLIIDEAHERSLNIDFLLGYLKQLLPKRPDLKLIITSATIDVNRFSSHFNDAPVIEVSGRTYPVDVWYRPMIDSDNEDNDSHQAIIDAITEIDQHERKTGKGRGGDILVFLSGERDIREAAKRLRHADFRHFEVLPFYARLSLAEQNRVFSSHRGRRIVLATNVAETSITVPGIRYVIDTGVARVSRYSVRTKVQRLPIEPISQASANQRKGRCGRVSDGICVRLYSEEDFLGRPEFTDAEILRTNLAAVILQMLQLKIGDIHRFPFVDAPDSRLINDGFKLLQELHAVDGKQRVTRDGRRLAQLSVDPTLARMLLAASDLGSLDEVMIVVSALSIQDPRERPAEKQQAADQMHRRFWDENSDFVAYVNLWRYYEEQRQELSQNQLRKLSKKEFLSYLRMREWRDIHRQLKLTGQKLGLTFNKEPADYTAVHQAMVTGLLGNIGFHNEGREYLGARNRKFSIFPGSSQNKKRPKWMVAAQLMETSQLFAHDVAKVEPEWLLEAAKHLVKRNHFEPHYDVKSGQVKAFEKVTLYGLTLVERQRVNYSQINPQECREVFIRSALVEGRYLKRGHKPPAFFRHNQSLIEELEALEAKSRRRDILAEDEVVFQFYDERIPGEVINRAGFEVWRKQIEQTQADVLKIPRERLMQRAVNDINEAQFPDELEWQGMRFPLSYHFEPGHDDDGVTVNVPVSLLHELPEHRLDWLVPGMLRDKCIDLIKSLPKSLRKHFVPVPDVVDKALSAMSVDNTPLTEALSYQLKRQTLIDVTQGDWHKASIENFFRFNIRVVDDRGKAIAASRDLHDLRARYKEKVQSNIRDAADDMTREGITRWDLNLPETVELKRKGISIRAYPALVDKSTSASMEVLDNPRQAHYQSLAGVSRLILLECRETVKYLNKELMKGKELGLTVVQLGKRDAVVDDICMAAACQLGLPDGELPRNEEDFNTAVARVKPDLVERTQQLADVLVKSLTRVVAIKKQLKHSKNALAMALAAGDVSHQLDGLFYGKMVFNTPYEWFCEYPRYLEAIQIRLEKVVLNAQKDRIQMAEVEEFEARLAEYIDKHGEYQLHENPLLARYRWSLEELRVSLFAQTLKTRFPVSGKRLNKLWMEITGQK
ncbi:ATP-dependent RNA helicase HrpA [Gilvimarinus sp. SDUM040013]|uniref:ATP-dependent RNA helicase HrpA n=1 Tax=Gilvimarinus gilvus TaxID=3058038 RepID=A0ABU4RV51_9GAMM|nr:ATP-dependent RNA helicase HrpA [Gilvimarinus sp. SDUM040013]MDO3386955.1 ATP-dependent RNA helicase HrpA [Gilvimarinus sp. SDUM040013]MDX6848151.1 ATP-dependent RNA helicase HrpA [Gilvimarinus sp. SDUM040013]